MTSTTPCATAASASTTAERPRYYPRQLITSDDLMLEQEYFRNRMRQHNRLMHGWGVVCGAKVCLAPVPSTGSAGSTDSFDPWHVVVTPGYVLGPYGDEIVIDCCRTIDLRTPGASGMTGDPCVQAVDPWCSDVFVAREPNAPLYIAVKYKECKTRPVRVQPIGCGCDDNLCEYSRLQDGYEIGILTACPDEKASAPDINDLDAGGVSGCPTCPSQPWVVLAKVQIGADGAVVVIDNCKCRRMVQSYGGFWWQCESGAVNLIAVTAKDGTTNGLQMVVPGSALELHISLDVSLVNNQVPLLTPNLGPGVNITSFTSDNPMVVQVSVANDAAPGSRTLTITSAAGSVFALEHAINIVS